MEESEQQLLEGELRAEAVREELFSEQVAEERAQELEEEAILTEESEANQLDAIREAEASSIQQQANDILQAGMSFQGPSMLKWGILLVLAITNDVIDLLALTGIGEILSWLISLGLTALILLILWMSDGEFKRAQRYVTDISDIAQQTQMAAQATEIREGVGRLTKGVAEKLKKIPGLKNIGIRETPRKNPLARVLLGSAIESIPYIGLVNLITVWIFFGYLAERHAYKEARRAAEESYEQMLTSATEMV